MIGTWMDGASGGFRGGGHTRPVPPPPPFEIVLYNCPPPLLKRKKNVSEHRNVSDLPPPRLGLARLSMLVALRKKGS